MEASKSGESPEGQPGTLPGRAGPLGEAKLHASLCHVAARPGGPGRSPVPRNLLWLRPAPCFTGAERRAGRRGAPCAGQVAPSSKHHRGRAVPSCPVSCSLERPGLCCSAVCALSPRGLCHWYRQLCGETRQASQAGPAPAGSGGTWDPRTLGQRSRLGSGVQDLPPEIFKCTKPPVKGMVFQEGLVQTEERKRWWEYKTRRPIWPMRPPAPPRGPKQAGAAARPSRGPALSLENKADGKTETCQPSTSGVSDKRGAEKSDALTMERLYRQLLVSLKRPKTKN